MKGLTKMYWASPLDGCESRVELWSSGALLSPVEVPPLGTAKHRPHLLRNKVDMLLLNNSQVGLCLAVTSPELPVVGNWVSCSAQGPCRMWPCNLPWQFGISYADHWSQKCLLRLEKVAVVWCGIWAVVINWGALDYLLAFGETQAGSTWLLCPWISFCIDLLMGKPLLAFGVIPLAML